MLWRCGKRRSAQRQAAVVTLLRMFEEVCSFEGLPREDLIGSSHEWVVTRDATAAANILAVCPPTVGH